MPVQKQQVEVGGRTLTLSNLEKVLWPETGLTKGDLIDYYVRVAPYLLPHLRHRPLVLTRYPDGIHSESFYQKNTPDWAPAWLRRFRYAFPGGDRPLDYLLADDAAGLAWIANQAAIEIHPWPATTASPEYPDRLTVDLDPAAGASWDMVRLVAKTGEQVLSALGLRTWPKTSGATGIHITMAIPPQYTFDQVTGFLGRLAQILYRLQPEVITLERMVARRNGKVYVDYLQNQRGKTITSVYGVRPRPGAPVSTPITWPELDWVHPDSFHLGNIFDRLAQVGDLYLPLLTEPQSLEAADRALRRQLEPLHNLGWVGDNSRGGEPVVHQSGAPLGAGP
ncbi:MAG: non-homologous end-joining DNA ligase [Symbiobacteriia bacterium]